MKSPDKMKNEGDVKAACKEIFKRLGIYYFMPVPVMYSRTGVPDFICCGQGLFIAIETKFGYNKPTPLQEIELEKIRTTGGKTFVINEKNILELEDALKVLLFKESSDVESR